LPPPAPPVGATFGASAPLLEQQALVEQRPPGARGLGEGTWIPAQGGNDMRKGREDGARVSSSGLFE